MPHRITKKITPRQWALLCLLLLAISLLVSGCGGPPNRVWLESPGWSRATYLGNTLAADPVPLAVAPDGKAFALFEVEEETGALRPEIVAIGADGTIDWRKRLPIDLGRAESPQVLLQSDRLHAFWIDGGHLYHLLADAQDGQAIGELSNLSGGRLVGGFDVGIGDDGQVTVWFAGPRRQPGLYRLPTLEDAPVLVDPAGIRPDIAPGSNGELQAVWTHYPSGFGDLEFLYARVPDDQAGPLAAVEPFLISSPSIGPTSVLQGPVLAVGLDQGYIFWSVIQRTGMSAGSARSNYVVFELDDPVESEEEVILRLPSEYRLIYQQAPQAQFMAGERVMLPAEGSGISGYLADLSAVSSPAGEVALAGSIRSIYLRNKNEIQAAAAYLRQGEAREYQLLSFTQAGSVLPSITSGPRETLYLTWKEKGEVPGFLVYLASTNETMVQELARLGSEDFSRLAADAAFGMLTGMLIAPIATLISLVVPLLIVGLTAFVRGEDEGLFDRGTLISLGLALVAYWVGKIGVLPSIGEYVPFSAWIPVIPLWLATPLRLGVPVLIGVIGFVSAWYFTYRREVRSPIYFILIYAGIDGLLTGAIYGLHFYAAF